MDAHLGYVKHDPEGRNGANSRNGTRSKTVITEVGPVEVDVPRDRDGTFEPQIVRKRQRRLDGIDEMVLSLSTKGLTHREIVVCDGLKGLPDAINTVWPRAIVQGCVLHLIRHTFRRDGRQHWDAIAKDLRPVYTAPTEAAAASASPSSPPRGVTATRASSGCGSQRGPSSCRSPRSPSRSARSSSPPTPSSHSTPSSSCSRANSTPPPTRPPTGSYTVTPIVPPARKC